MRFEIVDWRKITCHASEDVAKRFYHLRFGRGTNDDDLALIAPRPSRDTSYMASNIYFAGCANYVLMAAAWAVYRVGPFLTPATWLSGSRQALLSKAESRVASLLQFAVPQEVDVAPLLLRKTGTALYGIKKPGKRILYSFRRDKYL